MQSASRVLILSLAAGLGACTGQPEPQDGPLPDHSTPPPLPPGHIEFKFPETVVRAGTEVQTCYYLEPISEDLYVSALKGYQGKHGHHLVLFHTSQEYPPGTIRDCTSFEDMVALTPILAPVNFGLEKFPEGMAIRVPRGSQLVLQQHIVNTSTRDIATRDVAHLRVLRWEEVRVLAGFYGQSDVTFAIRPIPEQQVVAFRCTAPRDMNLLLVGPHMHEWGVRISVDVGTPGQMRRVVDVHPWRAEYRDYPPVAEFKEEAPLVLHKGDVMRTECVFRNDTAETLRFPREMCAAYGYYFPAPFGDESWLCSGQK